MTKRDERVRKCEQRVLEAAERFVDSESGASLVRLQADVEAMRLALCSGPPDMSACNSRNPLEGNTLVAAELGAAFVLRALVKKGSCNAETALEWADELEER